MHLKISIVHRAIFTKEHNFTKKKKLNLMNDVPDDFFKKMFQFNQVFLFTLTVHNRCASLFPKKP